MQPEAYPSAEQALDLAVQQGDYQVPVSCRCGWDADGHLLLLDRYHSGYPFGGGGARYRASSWRDVVLDDEDSPVVTDCDECGADIAPDIVVLRDRGGRCAQALADERSEDRAHHGHALNAALRRGDIVTAAHLLRAA